MAEKINKTEYEKANVNPFSAPTPGGSLTGSSDMPKAWERPPEYTDTQEAMEEIYMEITNEDNLMPLINLIDDGTPLDQVAQVVLYKGYTSGLYNPDLMTLLIEPTLYLLIAIADYAGIKNYVLYEGEADDPDAQIYGDDETPIMIDEDNEKPVKEDMKPKKDSLGKSLLSKVESELPEKIAKVKGEN